jgi:hypothetical protein
MTKKFDIHVLTQYRENYGDALAPYWKSKGGSTYVLAGLELALSDGIGAAAQAVVDAHRASIECRNDFCTVDIIDWELAEAGALTDDEKTQIKYGYGRVDFPSKRLAVR